MANGGASNGSQTITALGRDSRFVSLLDLALPELCSIMMGNSFNLKRETGHTRQTLDRLRVSDWGRENSNERM